MHLFKKEHIHIKNKNIIFLSVYVLINIVTYSFANRYTITLTPLILAASAMYIYLDEFDKFDFTVLKQRATFELAGNAFVIAMISQAAFNVLAKLVFNIEITNMSMQMFNIPIVPVSAVVLAPIIEETIFRKIIFETLDKRFNFWFGSIASSTIFAAAHLSLPLFVGYFTVGMVLCWFYKRSSYNIMVPLLAHTYMNFLVIIARSILIQ